MSDTMNLKHFFCIGKIGVDCINVDGTDNDREIFSYQNHHFQLLRQDIRIKQLMKDIKNTPEFSIDVITNCHESNISYLAVFFNSLLSNIPAKSINSRIRILTFFFNIPSLMPTDDCDIDTNIADTSDNTDTTEIILEDSITNLYKMLRQAHIEYDNYSELVENINVLHKSFKPKLRQYQLNAVKWMLNREIDTDYYPSEFQSITCPELPGQIFYYNPRTLQIQIELPKEIKIPSGGILADEMGLGKTVEVLNLILSNPRPKVLKRKLRNNNLHENNVKTRKNKLFCICLKKSLKKLISCTNCFTSQHIKCVGKYKQFAKQSDSVHQNYICPECWKSESIIPSRTTLIVSPASIKMQWFSEIKNHINNPNFKVLIYNGVKASGWISPEDLATYHVILTDYNTMTSEFYYLQNIERNVLRNTPKSILLTSPLKFVEFWRICLDEAQMAENSKVLCSKMINVLTGVHRWSITGTPIEKSVDNLYGLLYFQDCQPYAEYSVWKTIAKPFMSGENPVGLVNVLKKIMWRTCKSDVLDQICLPKQSEIVHFVTMSDLQRYFYFVEHSKKSALFFDRVKKIGQTLELNKIDSYTLKKVMEPLRQLRQDCTIPAIVSRSNETIIKKILTPKELLKHLLNKTEIECKFELRAMASSLNGLAALSILKNNLSQAQNYYKKVIQLSKEYTGTVSVDTLLQIHALYNLNWLVSDSVEKVNYTMECNRLEWKYIEQYNGQLSLIREQLNNIQKDVVNLQLELPSNGINGEWWRDLFYEIQHDSSVGHRLVQKINSDTITLSRTVIFTSIHGVDLKITKWLDQLKLERNNLLSAFKNIEFFTNNIKPKQDISDVILQQITIFLNSVLSCHLDAILKKESSIKPKEDKRKRKPKCMLCTIKKMLNSYECIIFDKRMKLENDEHSGNIGNWNPSFGEIILQTIYSFAKKHTENQTILREAEIYLKIIDSWKNEYKELSQLWYEVNLMAQYYDELNMCKLRLQYSHKDADDKSDNKLYTLSEEEADLKMMDFEDDLKFAELQLVRKQGTIKYFDYLSNRTEPGVCPICTCAPKNKYCVFECGHHLCMICLSQINTKVNVRCCICRHEQRFENLCYVTLNEKSLDANDNIEGDYPKKIEEIVRTIIKLKKNEECVKIIIFSSWNSILLEIKRALEANSILFRMKSTKFHKCIDQFKDETLGITCLLLPLSCGSKGLNLIEATHVFLVEPILNSDDELQAIGRIHRIGQTKETFIHRFIVLNTIEENIHTKITKDCKWKSEDITVQNLCELFHLNEDQENN